MLKALYDYAVRENLALPPGFVNKDIKGYICLADNGSYIGIIPAKESLACPDIGGLANGTTKSNVLAEKCSVVLGDESSKKTAFFRGALRDGGNIPALQACLDALENDEIFSKIKEDAELNKLKDVDRVTFKVGMKAIVTIDEVKDWWTDYRKQFESGSSAGKALCLITGEKTEPLRTAPPIKGLQVVGGHGKGDAVICFDKDSFCSYDLKQSYNAPVSAEAYAAVKAALDKLLSDAPIVAGMKFVHWYDKDISDEDDIISGLFEVPMEEGDEQDDQEPVEVPVNAARKRADATELVESVNTGRITPKLDAVYHILLMSGVNGRAMIRRYEMGSYQELYKNIEQWNSDLMLTRSGGTELIKPKKLVARLSRLIARQDNNSKLFDRLSKELSGITPAIINSILTGSQLPDSVVSRALDYIRSGMFAADDSSKKSPATDGIACQWLKAWLVRRERALDPDIKEEEKLMAYYNIRHPNKAYHCGALVAVYAAIQNVAMKDVNAGVVERFYSAASRTPSFVLGRLNELSNYHLDKIQNLTLANRFKAHLGELYSALGDDVPKTLNMADQAYFALGYHQYSALLVKEKNEHNSRKTEE